MYPEITIRQIFKQALQKAIDAGFNGYYFVDIKTNKKKPFIPKDMGVNDMFTMIFQHDFAKAFFGSENVDEYGKTLKEHKQRMKEGWHYPINYKWNSLDLAWGYHLKQMVLDEEPFKYLGKFL